MLTFKHYCTKSTDIRKHAQTLEYLTINITYHALNAKEGTKMDAKLAQLFAASLSFIHEEDEKFDGSYRNLLMNNTSTWENQYFLDVASLTLWEDHSVDYQESKFIFGIGNDMGFSNENISGSLQDIAVFFEKNVAFLDSHMLSCRLS